MTLFQFDSRTRLGPAYLDDTVSEALINVNVQFSFESLRQKIERLIAVILVMKGNL